MVRGKLLGFAFLLSGCSVPISAGLDEPNATQAVVALEKSGIAAEKERDPDHENAYRVVVARDDAASACLLVQRQQEVERTALLEGGGELQVLEFEEDLGADDLRERARFHAGRVKHLPAQAPGGEFDVVDGNHGRHCGSLPTLRVFPLVPSSTTQNSALWSCRKCPPQPPGVLLRSCIRRRHRVLFPPELLEVAPWQNVPVSMC